VVGQSCDANGDCRAFLWQHGGDARSQRDHRPQHLRRLVRSAVGARHQRSGRSPATP
jgi:hypothetical protein